MGRITDYVAVAIVTHGGSIAVGVGGV